MQIEGPTGLTKIRACDHMAMYNFYVGTVKKSADLPDGIGVTDVKAFNTVNYARPCEEIAKLQKK